VPRLIGSAAALRAPSASPNVGDAPGSPFHPTRAATLRRCRRARRRHATRASSRAPVTDREAARQRMPRAAGHPLTHHAPQRARNRAPMDRDGDSPITHPDDRQPVHRRTGRRGSALTATPVSRTGGPRRTATSAARTAAPGGTSSTRTSRSGGDLVTRDGDAPITFEQLYERLERTRAALVHRGPGPVPRTLTLESSRRRRLRRRAASADQHGRRQTTATRAAWPQRA
jgi:hypothetical protein